MNNIRQLKLYAGCLLGLMFGLPALSQATIITLGDGSQYEIKLQSHNGNTWTYFVREVAGKSLSHWNVGIQSCMDKGAVINSSPKGDETDGSTGFKGIKWDVGDGFTEGTFSVTLDADYPKVTVEAQAKAGKKGNERTGDVMGPDCSAVPLPAAEDMPQPATAITNPDEICNTIYAVHDGGLSDTQIVTIGTSGVERLDPDGFHPGLDIEGLDVSTRGEVYASSGDDGDLPGHLYQIDHETGTVYGIDDICFDFQGKLVCGTEVSAISFNPTDNSLWGWSEECGLVLINMANPRQSDLIFSHATDDFVACLSDDNRVRRAYSSYVEDMTWNNNGSLLYYADRSKVFSYDPATENVTEVAEVGGNVEAIEMLPEFDDKLLLNRHNSPTLTVLDLTDGTSYPSPATVGEFNDIEAIGTCLGDNIEPPLCVMEDTGWMYTKDSINDSTGTSPEFGVVRVGNTYFEIYGIAVRVDKETVTVALNSRLPVGGVLYKRNMINWGDIIFDFDGNGTKKYGVRFDATNDSLDDSAAPGLYEVTELKSVSKANSGHTNFSTYDDYVTQRGGEPSLGDMSNLDNDYFGNTDKMPTSIKTGIKVANDGFEMLDATQLAAKGLDFAGELEIPASAYDPSKPYSNSKKKPLNELGEYTFGFKFNRQDDMTGAFKAFIFTECGNDGILMDNRLPSCL